MADDIVQIIENARVDATSLSEFIYYPANVMVQRRLAPSIHTLNYYLDYLHGLELVYSQPTGTVTVNGEEIKTVRQAINDSVDAAILGDYQTQLDLALQEEISRSTQEDENTSVALSSIDNKLTSLSPSDVNISQGVTQQDKNELYDTYGNSLGITTSYPNGTYGRTQASKNYDTISTKDFGDYMDGTQDATVKLQEAINASVGKRLHIAAGDYLLSSGSPVVPSDSYITMDANAVIRQPNKGEASGFIIEPNSKNIRIIGGKIAGAYEGGVPMWQGDTCTVLTNGDTWSEHLEDNIGIHIRGRYYQRNNLNYTQEQMLALTDETKNIVIHDVEITGFGQSAIIADQISGSVFTQNYLHHCGRDGLRFYGAVDCIANNNPIYEMSPGYDGDYPNWNVYGIACTRLYGLPPTYPDPDCKVGRRSSRILMQGNTVENCHTWKGLDTHGGHDLRFIGNDLTNCYIGVGIDTGGYGTRGFTPPTNLVVSNNTFVSNSSARYKRAAITAFSSGASSDGFAGLGDGLTITGNTFDGYGGDNADGAISLSQWRNVAITGNTFQNFTRTAIATSDFVYDVAVTGNTFSKAYNSMTVTIVNGGSGYTQVPNVLVNGSIQKNLKIIPVLTGGVITRVDIVYMSNGWGLTAPTLTVQSVDGNGSGAVLTGTMYNPSVMSITRGSVSGVFTGNSIRHDSTAWKLDGIAFGAAPEAGAGFKVSQDNTWGGNGSITRVVSPQYEGGGTIGLTAIAFARVAADGTVRNKHPNIVSITKDSTGVYTVTLKAMGLSTPLSLTPYATILTTSDASCRAAPITTTKINVYTTTASQSTSKDADWSLLVYSSEY